MCSLTRNYRNDIVIIEYGGRKWSTQLCMFQKLGTQRC